MNYLFAGKILKIDLTNQTFTTVPTAPYQEKFLGGKGIGIKLLYDEVGPEIGALDPGNALIFASGTMNATPCPGASRTHIVSKSPMTQLIGACDCGGFWGSELKFAGYDAVVVKGKADKPVYISIDNDKVEFRDAGGVWGRDTIDAQAAIRQELDDPETQIFCIGPAGEKMVRYAIIAHSSNIAAGRTGLGAVMGSKNLKAIAVHGSKAVKFADPKKVFDLSYALHDAIRSNPEVAQRGDAGVAMQLDAYSGVGLFASANFQKSMIHGETHLADFTRQYGTKAWACFGCPAGCRIEHKVPGLHSGTLKCNQYTPLFLCDCMDALLNYETAILCQEGGLDVVQAGSVVSWVMELYQRGILTQKDTDGLVMEFGNGRAAIDMIKKIIAREGIGDVLAENFMTAAQKFGKGTEDYFIATKRGMSVQAFDLRPVKGSALGGAVSVRDATPSVPLLEHMLPALDFMEGEAREQFKAFIDDFATQIAGTPEAAVPTSYVGKAAIVKFYEDEATLSDTLGICKYFGIQAMMPVTSDKLAELYTAATGIEMTVEGLMEAAHRIHTLERAYCVREGLTRDDDTIPKRFLEVPLANGRFKGEMIDPAKLEEMKTEYYTMQGWDPATGAPTQETLIHLGMKDVAEDLKKMKIVASKEAAKEEAKGKNEGKNAK
jgi:aldehyde:ferredoxin oxidoreductase